MTNENVQEVIKLFPELETVELDGATDFNQVAKIIGSRNPKLIWPIINLLAKEASSEKSDELKKLEKLMGL